MYISNSLLPLPVTFAATVQPVATDRSSADAVRPPASGEDILALSDSAQQLIGADTGTPFGTENPEEVKDAEKIRQLKDRDAEVKRHEQAHKMTGGPYAGAIHYEYTTGPDGKRYATGGHVDFNVGKESTPEETIMKARTIYRAALAPGDPSASDVRLAMAARRMEQEARMEIQSETRETMQQAELSALDQLAFI